MCNSSVMAKLGQIFFYKHAFSLSCKKRRFTSPLAFFQMLNGAYLPPSFVVEQNQL